MSEEANKGRRKPTRVKLGQPRPVDVHVGGRVRLRRTMLGMSQEKLGKEIGLTFQQVQKYERGTNRIGSSRLYELANVLDVPVSFFFDDMPPEVASTGGKIVGANGSSVPVTPVAGEGDGGNELTKRQTLELVRAYYRIKNERVRKRVFELVKSVAKSDDNRSEDVEPPRKIA